MMKNVMIRIWVENWITFHEFFVCLFVYYEWFPE